MRGMKNAAIGTWLIVAFLILTGAGIALSPFFIDGGVVNAMFPPMHGDWLGFLLRIAAAIVLGIAVISSGAGLAISMGLASLAGRGASRQVPPLKQGP